jgi:lysophospholipase L1-like esterase
MRHSTVLTGTLLLFATSVFAACASSEQPAADAATVNGRDGGRADGYLAHDDAGASANADAVAPADGGLAPTTAVPSLDAETTAHVRDLIARGAAMGNRRAVVAKIGDSITESGSFLQDCGMGWFDAGNDAEVDATIRYFSMVPLEDRNSLSRASVCAVGGWSADRALEGYPDCALTQELLAIKPAWAIVMYGTNDLERFDLGTYIANMTRIADIIESHGTVTVLSTIPPRGDSAMYDSLVGSFNDAIRSMAASRHLPLIDYWAALQPLPNRGLSDDGVHPNVYIDPNTPDTDSCALTPPGLQFGYNVRNYTTLQMLSRLRAF